MGRKILSNLSTSKRGIGSFAAADWPVPNTNSPLNRNGERSSRTLATASADCGRQKYLDARGFLRCERRTDSKYAPPIGRRRTCLAIHRDLCRQQLMFAEQDHRSLAARKN